MTTFRVSWERSYQTPGSADVIDRAAADEVAGALKAAKPTLHVTVWEVADSLPNPDALWADWKTSQARVPDSARGDA